ncbi:hypothetical protein I79_023551 [Cricetulus griseus]|uniref:Uncharacterized protein n=1 Tax=Cricetulus griseus TaxID=10029 RepID=G3II83_CRIGR|nr:hypothetical protein I79_023551 [Cricetulus griseus]
MRDWQASRDCPLQGLWGAWCYLVQQQEPPVSSATPVLPCPTPSHCALLGFSKGGHS